MDKAEISGNLFTDIYELRSKLYGEDPDEQIAEVKRQAREALEGGPLPKGPKYLLVKTTNRCNSGCEYCTHAVGRVPAEEKFDVPHDILMKTIEDAADMGVHAISLSGGEPLLRPDIEQQIRAVADRHMVPVLLTNGLLLDKKWEVLGEAGLRYLVISFDSADRCIYEKQRGADFDLALKGIEAALRLRDRYPDTQIHVTAVLTRDNGEEFLELVRFMQERRIKIQISPYHKREGDMEDYSLTEYEKAKELAGKLLEIKRNGGYIANSEGFIAHLPEFFCGEKVLPKGFSCRVGVTNMVVDTYMDVKPCWSCWFEPAGNLSKDSLKDIWNSEKMQELRGRMRKNACEGCWYLCTTEVQMMLEDKIFLSGGCDD